MQLQELAPSDRTLYNFFVAHHPLGSFLQSWDWGDWQEQLGHRPRRFALEENGNWLITAQVLVMQIPGLGQYYCYLPQAPLVQPGMEPAKRKQSLQLFFNELKRYSPNALFLRFEPPEDYLNDLQPLKMRKTVNIQAAKTMWVDLTMLPEQLLGQMHPKTRYNIRVAQRHGVVIQPEIVATPQFGLHLTEVVNLIVDTARRQNYRGHSAIYYKNLIDFFGMRNSDIKISIYKALYRRELLTGAIMLDFGRVRMYLFGGSSPQYRNVMAPYLLHWQAMTDAHAAGLHTYDLGGSETASGNADIGFSRFKQGFGGRQIQYPGAQDIILKPAWYTIYTLLRTLKRKL